MYRPWYSLDNGGRMKSKESREKTANKSATPMKSRPISLTELKKLLGGTLGGLASTPPCKPGKKG